MLSLLSHERNLGRTVLTYLSKASISGGVKWKIPTLKDSYDVVVLGGGTGGITFAKEATALGVSTALLDYVSPSPRGSQWGLGGTCTNVGCVPKKLMHTSGIIRHYFSSSPHFGWTIPNSDPEKAVFSWEILRDNIQAYIKNSNYSSGVKLKDLGIDNCD